MKKLEYGDNVIISSTIPDMLLKAAGWTKIEHRGLVAYGPKSPEDVAKVIQQMDRLANQLERLGA
jgi:hypothetical protein